jgi:uncharacterized lipoprotein YehR (DUF1307 family)
MMNIPKEYIKNTAMIWVGFLLLFVFIYVFSLKPVFKSKSELTKKLEKAKQEYEDAKKMSDENARKELAEEIEGLRERIRNYVTDSDGSVNLTFDISRLAKSNRVSGFSIRSLNQKNLSDIVGCHVLGENKMEVEFKGNFRQFAKFLNQLERHDPVVFIDKFSVVRDRNEGANNHITMNLSVFVEKKEQS